MSHWILAGLIIFAFYAGAVIGYFLAVMNIGIGREDEYQRGFKDGRTFQQIKEMEEINDG